MAERVKYSIQFVGVWAHQKHSPFLFYTYDYEVAATWAAMRGFVAFDTRYYSHVIPSDRHYPARQVL